MKLGQSGRSPGVFYTVALVLWFLVGGGFLVGCDDSSGTPDAAVPDPDGAPPPDAGPSFDADPNMLSSRGLYSDIDSHTIATDAVEYSPVYALWADEAAKRRWIVLPPGKQIDTTDMDHWDFPAGTKLWKEFATPEGKLLETRLIEKLEDGTFFFGAFVWQEDGKDARLTLDGASNILGTEHDVPSKARCLLCHKGENGRILGFSALQLSKDGPAPTLKSLRDDNRLSNPPLAGVDYRFPGDDKTKAALGYIHANCGHCHTPTGTAYMDTCIQGSNGELKECMQLQFSIADANGDNTDARNSAVVKSLIGFVTHSNQFEGQPRLTPGNPEMSAIYLRPSQRGSTAQMPPAFSTEVVDTTGVAAIEAWINSLQ